MDLYRKFDEDLRNCRKCTKILREKFVDPSVNEERVKPRPIVVGIKEKPIMLIGQSPGLREYETGKPFIGDAGKKIREIFSVIGIPLHRFEDVVWPSAAVKCYPGRKLVKHHRKAGNRVEDEVPTSNMVKNCQPFLVRQMELVRPKIVVTLGVFPLKAYLRLRGRSTSEGILKNFVGTKEEWNGSSVIFFPHTSGASRWLNNNSNKKRFEKAQLLLRKQLIDHNILSAI